MKTITSLFIIVILVLFYLSCHDRRAWTSADPWYNPKNGNSSNFLKVEDTLIKIIELNKLAAAEKLLKDSPIVKLSKEQSYYFLSDSTGRYNSDKYLIRAVYLRFYNKGYSVYQNKDTLSVFHGTLGHRPVPMNHHALIVELPYFPKVLFTDCFMDE
jgi:hypothetical protein